MLLFQNELGKFDAMRPHLELEGAKAEKAEFCAFEYQSDTDHDGLVLLLKRQVHETNRLIPSPVHEEGQGCLVHQEYAVAEGT